MRKKIYILILLIFLLISSTYAWFTTSKNVRVDTLDVKVATSGNIEISADAINWKTQITKEELLGNIHSTYQMAVNQIPKDGLYPISTIGNVTNGRMDMFFGKVNLDNNTSTYKLTATKENDKHGTDGKYIVFDIFLKVSNDKKIYLNSTSSIEAMTGIENATRIAMLNYGSALSASDAQNLNKVKQTIIIEPNCDSHTSGGIHNAENIYGITGLKQTENMPINYYGVKREIITPILLNSKSEEYFSLVNPDIKLKESFFGGQTNKELLNINKGITKLRLYLWIEGQDIDCEDSASGANLNFNLQFTI